VICTILALSCGGSGQTSPASAFPVSSPEHGTWILVWSDEFNGGNGALPDAAKWVIETGGNGWGNNELEYYTARPQNAHQQDGKLVITAAHETYTDPGGVARSYTSARLKTAGKFAQQYGRFEARIKIPQGQGIWPAFWMLGNDIAAVKWPFCGEIDIMENIGKEPAKVHGSMHGPGYSRGNPLTAVMSSRTENSATISMSLPWNGKPTSSGSTWMGICTRQGRRKIFHRGRAGCTTIRFSSC
jgi:beta-glucanase (GH16 family)